jgi:hypothetical protein
MTDALDTKIRALVIELIDSTPPAPSLSEIEFLKEHSTDRAPVGSAAGASEARRGGLRLRIVAVSVAAAAILLAGGLVLGLGGSNDAHSHVQSGTWTLMDDSLSGTWQQNTTGGPPPGDLSCPTVSTCFAMSGKYASAQAGSPLLSESLYVSTDVGATWSELPMPQGFAPTSVIACGGVSDCAAGGTYMGRSVLITTADGGHSFTMHPLPVGIGHLDTLSCPSASYCAGLAADSELLNIGTTDATFLSTSDGGTTFSDAPILTGDSMQSLACSSDLDCTAVGWNDASGPNDWTAGVAARTNDGGRTWTAGALPAGLGINYLSQLSCADSLHCSVSGSIAIAIQNPPQCAKVPDGEGDLPTNAQSPAVQAISQVESRAATAEELKEAQRVKGGDSGGFYCNSNAQSLVGDIASTMDGGLTWSPDPLPAGLPQPMFNDLSCPTAEQCWASGSDAVPRRVGTTYNGGGSMLLGTTDGGASWSQVTFNVPAGAENYDGQAYLSTGFISCPSAGVCVALGTGAQSAPSVPTYSFVVPGSA